MEIFISSKIEGLILNLDRAFSKIGASITAIDIHLVVVLENAVGGDDSL